MKTAINNLSKQNPLLLAAGAALLVYVVYMLARKTVTDVVKGAGGLLTGNNAITEGTSYEGAGVLGTLGAATNAITGGAGEAVGGWIAGLLSSDSGGESLYYAVNFPDGSRHAVPASSVARSGAFTYSGKKYILGMQDGARVARYA